MLNVREVIRKALRPQEGPRRDISQQDVTLDTGSAWVVVGNLSVYILRTEEGVTVAVLPAGMEDAATYILAGCAAFYDDAALMRGTLR